MSEARGLCEKYGRKDIGDQMIGKILSAAQPGADGLWPCEAVREVLEEVRAKEIAIGMSVGRYNARGATWRGQGGDQERELAEMYRNWSKRLSFEYPFTAELLEMMARSYDHDAQWHDADEQVRRRTRH